MFSFLISFFTSGAMKWVAILMIVFGLASGLYLKHRQIVDLERETALQKYNNNQLQQALKDKDLYVQQMEEISKHKSEIVAELYIEKDRLEEKLSKVIATINTNVTAGHDRGSSKILKDTFKALGEMK